jgi:Tol biopolymer transport system component
MQKITFVLAFILCSFVLKAQNFGRNKPVYQNFDFKVVETTNFKIHHYIKNPEVVNRLSAASQQWYQNHKNIFKEDILFKNPIIFYNDHADFQQTNTISGQIGIGTGGVTEALKNRVVMPLAFSNQATHHVLAHELVHAFQFNNIQSGDSTNLNSLANLPLWMIEGMAEYFSLSRIDPFTAMWMRDAILNNNLPSIDKMNDFRYFPYRYGHSLIAFIGGTFGDDKLNDLFISTAKYGLELGFIDALGVNTKTITNAWHRNLKELYNLGENKEKPQGKKLISSENGGRMNLSPSISPNGKYLIFLSEKNVFTTDLYLADAQKGDIIRKVSSNASNGDLDYINVMESAGSWSPDSETFIYVGVKKGNNVIVMSDVSKGKTLETIEIPGVPAFANPVFSPDGKDIYVSGLVNGQTDIYKYNLKSKKTEQITFDIYSENMISFSPDGMTMAFCYDRRSVDEGRKNGRYSFDIALMNVDSRQIRVLDVFFGADNLNPTFDHEGNIYFVSDRDGFRNLYTYDMASGTVFQRTEILTGLSGISGHSPMLSASTKRDRVVFTHYYNSEYTIYQSNTERLVKIPVSDLKSVDLTKGSLPPLQNLTNDIVGNHFRNINNRSALDTLYAKNVNYKPHFKLDYITGGAGMVGMGANAGSFNNNVGLGGGVAMVFSDILGDNQIFSQLSMNGEILDIGGMVSYINRSSRVAWGIGVTHLPLRTGFQSFQNGAVIDGVLYEGVTAQTNLIRVFDKGLSAFAHYPFSTTLRLEAGIAGTHRSFRWDEYNDYYVGNQFTGYQLVGSDRKRVPTGESLQLDQYYTILKGFGGNVNFGLVGDNSFFGFTAPLAGQRFRLSVEQFFGNDNYTAVLADYRKYFWLKPVSLAFRSTNYLRFEKEVNSVYPFYLGNMGFLRGLGGIINADLESLGLTFRQLLGSKIMMLSGEVRLPFTGPKQLALINASGFLSDINLFIDSGVTFDNFEQFRTGTEIYTVVRDESGQILVDEFGNVIYGFQNVKPSILTSVGISARINVFGALIIEPYYARVLTKGSSFQFGLNLIPGW